MIFELVAKQVPHILAVLAKLGRGKRGILTVVLLGKILTSEEEISLSNHHQSG